MIFPASNRVNLPGVAVLEGPDFQIQQNVAAEVAVVKDEVNIIVLAAHGDAALAGFKQKARTEFEEEFLEMVQERGFDIALGVFGAFAQAGEFKHVGIANQVFDGFLRLLRAGAFDDGSFVFGKPGALKQQRADLALQLAHGPVALETFVLVERAFERVVNADQFDELSPGEMKDGVRGQGRDVAGRFPHQWCGNWFLLVSE